METMDTDKATKKAALKELRAQRKELIAAATSEMKAQKRDIKDIEAFLTGRAATIPDIAQGIGLPTDKTLWYIASLKKYGRIVEGSKAGAFFNYALNEPENNSEPAEV